MTSKFIQTCAYKQIRDPNCSVFSIDQILKEAEPDEKEREIMLIRVSLQFQFKKPLISLN